MKLWTMPRIVVESFTPNDSIAVCNSSEKVHPVDLGDTTLYWNYIFPNLRTYDLGEGMDISGNEFTPPDSADIGLQPVSFYTGFSWLIPPVYRDSTVTYDVWVISNSKAYIYQPGYAPDIAPTEQVNWS